MNSDLVLHCRTCRIYIIDKFKIYQILLKKMRLKKVIKLYEFD